MREGVTWEILTDTFPNILTIIIVLYIRNLLNYYYFHTLYYYCGRQDAILISGLLLRMRMYLVTPHFKYTGIRNPFLTKNTETCSPYAVQQTKQSETPTKGKIWHPVLLFWKLPEWWRNYRIFRLALRTLQIRTHSLFTDTLSWMQSNNDCSKKKYKEDGVHLQVTLKLLSNINDTIAFDKNQLNMAIWWSLPNQSHNNKAVARRVCVRINNFGNTLKREGEELMG